MIIAKRQTLRFRSHWALALWEKWKLNIINGTGHTGSWRNLRMQIFAKEWIECSFNPIALARNTIGKESLFCNAITNAQCEWNLKVYSHLYLSASFAKKKCAHLFREGAADYLWNRTIFPLAKRYLWSGLTGNEQKGKRNQRYSH